MLSIDKVSTMERNEKFRLLMDIIDAYSEESGERDTNSGTFSFLREGMYMRHIPITPRKSVRPEQLKSFLALNVLQIYRPNTASNITYLTIQRYLDGQNDSSYSYNFDLLDECFDMVSNRECAARNSYLINDMQDGPENTAKCDAWIPYILIQQIEKTASQKLLDYWELCDKNWEKKKYFKNSDEEKTMDDLKQESYREILMAVALQEVFVKACFFDTAMKVIAEGREQAKSLGSSSKEVDIYLQRVKNGEEVGEELLDRAKQVQNNILNISGYVDIIIAYVFLTIEFLMGVYAHVELVMMLETMNVGSESGERMKKYYETFQSRNMDYPFWKNKNKSKYYRQMEEEVEKILISYIIKNGCGDYHKAVVNYFKLIAQKDKRDSRKLWETKCIIARPLLIKNREETNDN